METNSSEKGRALEQAVKFIQEVILSSTPELKGTLFSIETNVRDNSSGVLHEIDVLVKTHLNSDYEATLIFECKNWAKPVDKNQIIILAEKVDALRASRGFIVAKSLTREAEAQLEQKKRLQFIRCTEDFLTPFTSIHLLHRVTDLLPIVLQVKWRDIPPSPTRNTLDWKTLDCCLSGNRVDFLTYINAQIEDSIRKNDKTNSEQYRNCGTHWGQFVERISFSKGELILNGMDVEYLDIPLYFFVKTGQKKLISKFELEGRGRSYAFEPIDDFQVGKPLEIHLVQKFYFIKSLPQHGHHPSAFTFVAP